MFAEIAHHAESKQPWLCEIIFFGKKWAAVPTTNRSEPNPLWHYWLSIAWQQSANARSQITYNVAQEAFANALSKKGLKPKPHLLYTMSHLNAMSKGMYPGFVPAEKDNEEGEIYAPIQTIQNAYRHHYGLDTPMIIMHPYQFFKKNSKRQSIYYSLEFPTLLNSLTNVTYQRSIMNDLVELTHLIKINQMVMLESTATHYEFFHPEVTDFTSIHHTKELSKKDNAIKAYYKGAKKSFPYRIPFLRGCVRITLTTKSD